MDAPRREPIIFAAGDTLWFVRFLPDYLPADGWALSYALTATDTGKEAATVQSVANGDAHEIKQEGFAANFDPKEYILAGYAVNQPKGFRHQIYYEPLSITPDLADGAATGPIETHPQRMIRKIEAQLEYMAEHFLKMSDEQRNRFEMVERPVLMAQLREFKEMRQNEVQHERARNGYAPTNVVQPFFNIG